ncbi:MAG: leucine-rich repeat protein, partial [Bacilli bacterium]|nr:leucine-rich repeat protein [Bacilli bacterium]
MKKNKHLILIAILIIFLSFATVSCKKKNNDITKTEQYKIYTLAKDSGYPGTYEEWLETIKGIDGTSIEKVEINTLGELIITLSTGEVINLGRVKGTDGLGIKNVEINDSGELIVTFTDDTTKNLGRILGTSGTNGVGVKSMVVNDYGELILTYTDDVVINLGKIAGKNGIDGIGIKDVTINDEGELLISLTDGTIKNLGVIKERPKEDEVYTVKFVSFDEEIKEIKVKEGCFLETPTINEVEGYRLLGWYLGEDKWRFNIDTVKKDITLIAKWEKIVEEITPVYQGMSIEQASDVKERIRRVNDVNNSVGIKDAIDDFLDVITTERVEYYAKKGEKFNIVVHLYNPTEYEILSFTLNERKYQSYEFKEGSNSTELIIEVDAGMKPGLKEYTIDAIKYVDKTEIKDVRMDGKRTVKAGIKYDVLPTATVIEEAITSTSYSSIIELKDDNNLMNTQNGMYFFLYDGTNIVYNTLLKVGLNNISYDNLQMGSNYEYMIIGIYDDFSGKGKQAVNLGSKKFASLDGFIVEDATCTKNSISLSIKEESNKATINEINLLIGEEIVRTINNIDNVVFENLLTNTNYTVQVVYSYEFEGATRKNTYTLEYKTLENNRPTFEIESLTSDKYSISYKVTSSDIDNVVTKKQFNLYLNDLLIKKSENEEDVFNELLSNNNYTLEVVYLYDLLDGKNEQTVTVKRNIKTVALEVPKVDIVTTSSINQISISQMVTDIDNIIKISNPRVLNSITAQVSMDENYNCLINAINSNTTYQIELTYVYDLNDGNGENKVTRVVEVSTLKDTPKVSLNITDVKSTSALLMVNVYDINQTGSIKEILLYKGATLIKNLSLTDYNITGLTSNSEYKVVLVYGYDLSDGAGANEIKKEIDFKTLKETPDVSLKLEPSKTEINVKPVIKDIDKAGMIRCVELYRNNILVDTKTEDYIFTNLLSNTTYTVKLYYVYDLNNGQDEMVLTSDIITTSKIVPTVDVTFISNKNNISYEVSYTDIENTLKIESIKLFKDNVEILSSDVLNSIFSNLYSNTTYEIRVTYSYDLNEGNGRTTSIISKTIKTLNKSLPVIGIKIDSVTDKEIKGKVNVSDPDNVFNIIDIKLYQNDNLLETTLDSLEFNYNVSSNIEYTIAVEYFYDLDDGMGVQNKTYEYVIRSTKQVPTMIFTPYYVSKDSLEYNLLISDNNVTGRINLIALYEGLTFIRKLNESETKLENLKSNTNYTIRINYVYDFDDGYGSRELNEEYKFKTLKEDPTYELSFNNITKDGFSINHSINDIDGALSFKQVDILLNNVVVKTVTSLNDVSFSKLLSNNRYLVVVRFIKDLNNGEEEVSYQEYVRTLAMEKPSIDITLDSTKTTINYSYKITDNDNISTLKDIKLYHNNKEVEGTDNLYTNLLSNNTYKLVITLLNNYHDGRDIQEETYTKEIKTKALEDIELDIKLEALKREINYKHTLVDVDGISKIVEIKLYLGNKLIKATKDLTEKEFTDLFSNTTYRVIYVVEKDFNDGLGVQTFEYEATTKTLALMIPVISMSFTSNAESINYKLITVDNDQIINHVKLDVYNGDILIKTITKFDENIINELESNTLYTFRLSYTYNLNENSDDLTTTIDYVYSTLAYNISISKLEVLNETSPKTNEDVNIKLYLDNKSNIKVSYLIINGEKYNILGGDSLNNVIIIMKAPQMSGQMNVKVERMGYIINGVTVEQEVEGLNNLNIEIFSRLDIIDISLVNGTNFDKDGFTLGYIIKIDNPKNYLIKEISYYLNHNLITESNLQIIDNNHLYIMANFYESTYIKMHYVKYIDETGNECIRNYTSNYVFTFKPFYVDQFTFSLSVHQITTPEELMNMDENSIYELVNDLDMTGYSWNPYLFKGYFDGKGHTISNLTYIHEDKWDVKHNESYDLITNILALQDATFKNVYFKDLYVDVDTTCIDTTSPDTKIYPFKIIDKNDTSTLENVLISGYLNYKYDSNDLSGVFKYEGYIVDHLYLNNKKIENDMVITNELFNSKDFKENTLGWNFKEKEVKEYDGLIYSIIDNSYIVITGYKGENENLVIPSVIDGLPVIAIDDLAFLNNKTIKSVELAESLLVIGGSILSGCSNLTDLTIYNNKILGAESVALSLFGKIEFENAYSTNGGYVPNNLSTVTIGGNNTIKTAAFYSWTSLKAVEIFEGIKKISDSAFAYCKKLNNVIIPNSVNYIGRSAFDYCENLKGITLPENLPFIDSEAFGRCGFESINLPKSLEIIKDNLFNGCTNLKEVNFPNTLQEIGEYAFNGCSALERIILHNGIKTIKTGAFYFCDNLKEVYIPKGIETIGNSAFDSNPLIFVGEESCPDGWNNKWNSGAYDKVTWGYVGTLTQDGVTYIITTSHAEVTSIEGADVRIPAKVLYDGNEYPVTTIKANSITSHIDSLYIPKTVEILEPQEDELSHVGRFYFGVDNKLESWSEYIKSYDIQFITQFVFNVQGFVETENIDYFIQGNSAVIYKIKVDDPVIPTSIEFNGTSYNVTSIFNLDATKILTKITIPEGITFIGFYAFNGCTNLIEVNLPNSLQEICEGAFSSSGITSINIPGSVNTIWSNAFASCNNLTSVTLNKGITSIMDGAFSGCTNLTSIILPTG